MYHIVLHIVNQKHNYYRYLRGKIRQQMIQTMMRIKMILVMIMMR